MANSKDNIAPISYSKIIMNREYGTNSKTVYVNMCNSFGWDKTQIGCFSRGRSLCAVRADKERKRDIWFIYNPNFDVNFTNVRDNDNKPIDTILDNGEAIKEIIPFHYETDHTPERVVFAKNQNGKYTFLGIYKCNDEDTHTRIWHRYATEYPIV